MPHGRYRPKMGGSPDGGVCGRAHDDPIEPITRTGRPEGGPHGQLPSGPRHPLLRGPQRRQLGCLRRAVHPHVELEAFGGVTATGVDAVRAFDQVWKSAAPDFTITPLLRAQTDDSLLCEILAWGTQTEVLTLPAGDLPPTGREF